MGLVVRRKGQLRGQPVPVAVAVVMWKLELCKMNSRLWLTALGHTLQRQQAAPQGRPCPQMTPQDGPAEGVEGTERHRGVALPVEAIQSRSRDESSHAQWSQQHDHVWYSAINPTQLMPYFPPRSSFVASVHFLEPRTSYTAPLTGPRLSFVSVP